jgi:4-carboxymuconolactone decarboxylase
MTEDTSRRARGEAILQQMFGGVPAVPETSRDLMAMTVDHLFGEVWARPGLALRDRSLATVAVLAALGREPQLELHLRGALQLGITPSELRELMMHLAHYSGWPTGLRGLAVLDQALASPT